MQEHAGDSLHLRPHSGCWPVAPYYRWRVRLDSICAHASGDAGAGLCPRAASDGGRLPGALRPHHAADGDLVRLRLAGGALTPAALLALAEASEQFGDGSLGLTSRANLQIRGLAAGSSGQLAGAVRAAGLLPSLTHERVRNIVASPWSGRRASSRARIDGLVADLDLALCLRPGLAELPGRFLFAVDDGSGDVAGLGADVVLQATAPGRIAVRVPAGGIAVPEIEAVAVALAMAEAFLAERAVDGGTAWRIADLDDGPARVLGRCADHGEMVAAEPVSAPEHDHKSKISGILDQADGLLGVCALVPLGVLEPAQVRAVAAAAGLSSAEPGAALRVTPWRGLVIRDLEIPAALAARELLSAYGLVVDDSTAWSRVTACAGKPGCAKARADVRCDAADFVATALPSGPAVHWAGCERGCGTPSGPVAVAIATGSGYELRDGDRLSPSERDWIGAR